MRLLIFIAVIIGIAVIFGAVYGISALLERRRRGGSPRTTVKTSAPDDDPEFLRNLARRLAEEEAQKGKESGSANHEDEAENDK